ncbi:hypothetical protein GUJ93_ZPchr0010g9363 [Zizania palustris]|uniref:Uncharacterized protein n=1 Tax=Zizania palustris TaxID=103762 RepID=A0A8J5W734_ZIZPA|nr:hypothetical protein GUJ93_ZPchr0010g9363 [Zizania palustris]
MLVQLRCTHVGQSSNRRRVHAERSSNPRCATQPIPLVRCLASHAACPADADVHALSSDALANAPAVHDQCSNRPAARNHAPVARACSGGQHVLKCTRALGQAIHNAHVLVPVPALRPSRLKIHLLR